MRKTHAPTASRFLSWISGHPGFVVCAAIATAVIAAGLASKLDLRTSISELLPSSDPGVVALNKTQRRMGDLSLLLVGISSPDPDANLRYADLLTRKLRALPPSTCALAAYNVRDVRGFFEAHRWLYFSLSDLEHARDRLRTEIARRKNPLLLDLDDNDESIAQMRKRIEKSSGPGSRFPGGLFTSDHGRTIWIAALPPGGLFVEHAGEGLWTAARALLAANPPERFHPGMRAEIAGPVATAIASRQAVERDIEWVTTTCLSLVALSIGLYFRRLRSIPLVGIPAVIGTLMAFAVAELAFGSLNSSTAFLGSIILGNGINYAIVFMSRYEEHRASGQPALPAMEQAIARTWSGTGVAALSAAAAYVSLTITSFRGFSQFGVMGATGALFCWLATFTVLPAMLVVLDRTNRLRSGRRAPLRLAFLGRALEAHRRSFLTASVLVAALATVGLTHFLRDPFEYDFRKLNAKLHTSEESKRFDKNLEELFGRWPSPTIVLADRVEDVEKIRAAIRKQDAALPGKDVIGQIFTVYDFLPGTPEVQRAKLAVLGEIRKLIHDPALEALSTDEREQLRELDPPTGLRELFPEELPPLARRPFTEVDGHVGRVVLVYPVEGTGLSVWNGKDLLRIAAVLQHIHLAGGQVIDTSGSAVVFGAMIRSIIRDGPIATVASLIAVLIIVAFTIRPLSSALLAVGTLLTGVLWMTGAAGLARVHVTFLNFIALPITFGIGAEYALNVVARYQEDRDISRAVTATGGAVALCSWTTIIGYGSLLAARNQALQGFGAMAILGELACLGAALIAMPALVFTRGQPVTGHHFSGPSSTKMEQARSGKDEERAHQNPGQAYD